MDVTNVSDTRTCMMRRAAVVVALSAVATTGAFQPAYADTPSPFDLSAVTRIVTVEDPVEVDWRTLAGLDYRTGKLSEQLEKLNGKLVKIPGFMVPLEDGAEGVNEFLLVPYFGACIHTPPPPPNQIVYVRMKGGEKVEVNYWDPIWMEGDLTIESTDSPYGVVGHQMAGTKISPYQWK